MTIQFKNSNKDIEDIQAKDTNENNNTSKVGILAHLVFLGVHIFISLFFLSAGLFMASGSNKGVGYTILLAVLSSNLIIFLAIWIKKAWIALPICYLIVIATFISDANFWKSHNKNMCTKLRNDPRCTLSNGSWECNGSANYGNMVTSNSICKNNK